MNPDEQLCLTIILENKSDFKRNIYAVCAFISKFKDEKMCEIFLR